MAVIPKLVRGFMVPGVTSNFNVLRCSCELSDFAVRFRSCCSSCDSGGDSPPLVGACSDNNSGGPTLYDCRKYGHQLSANNVCPNFETLSDLPTGVFRNTSGEILGPNAGKCLCYQNPEYYSFHHMSFYDLNLGLRKYRKIGPKTMRKPIVYRPPC